VNDLDDQLAETLARRAAGIDTTPDLADVERRAANRAERPRRVRRALSAAAIVVLVAGASVAVALNRPGDTAEDASIGQSTSPEPTAPSPDTTEQPTEGRAEAPALQPLDSPWCAGRTGPIERLDVLRPPPGPTDGFDSLSAAAASFFTAHFVDTPSVPAEIPAGFDPEEELSYVHGSGWVALVTGQGTVLASAEFEETTYGRFFGTTSYSVCVDDIAATGAVTPADPSFLSGLRDEEDRLACEAASERREQAGLAPLPCDTQRSTG